MELKKMELKRKLREKNGNRGYGSEAMRVTIA